MLTRHRTVATTPPARSASALYAMLLSSKISASGAIFRGHLWFFTLVTVPRRPPPYGGCQWASPFPSSLPSLRLWLRSRRQPLLDARRVEDSGRVRCALVRSPASHNPLAPVPTQHAVSRTTPCLLHRQGLCGLLAPSRISFASGRAVRAFLISPLPPCRQSRYRPGPLPSTGVTRLPRYYRPSASLQPTVVAGYTAYLCSGRGGLLHRPRHRTVATTPRSAFSQSALRHAAFVRGLSLRAFYLSRPPVVQRSGNSPTTPYGGRGQWASDSSVSLLPSYRALALPGGSIPPERAMDAQGRTGAPTVGSGGSRWSAVRLP